MQDAWDKLSQDDIRHIHDRFHVRIHACNAARGDTLCINVTIWALLNVIKYVSFGLDNRCGLGVTSLLLMKRTRVRSPVKSLSWLMLFRGFPSTVRQMSGNLSHIRPQLSYVQHISSKPYTIRLRTSTVCDLGCCTWPSLNNKQQQHLVVIYHN